ncbi:hypothetical protein [Bradyrhizobium sp. 193]|uniref:hypothetical protein n=1 Tax=Bradyrhizobium sp. 193 TaxID=2782661 RepID=UPI001FF73B88|nr:hypothetical protein [Bradyrhizobium sp. 193]
MDKIIEDYNNRIASSCGAVGPFAVRCVVALPLHQPALEVPTIASSQPYIELFDSVILPQQFRFLRSYTIANMPDDTSAQFRWSANVSADLRIRGRGIRRNGSGTGGVMTHIELTSRQAIAGAVAASVLASTGAGAVEGEPRTLTRRRLKVGMSGFPRSLDPVIATDTVIRRTMP